MQPDTFYHIFNHANGSENLFRSDENYRYFLQQWGKYIEAVAGTYAYCLMPNHIHFLIRTRSEEEMESTFGKFLTIPQLFNIPKKYGLNNSVKELFESNLSIPLLPLFHHFLIMDSCALVRSLTQINCGAVFPEIWVVYGFDQGHFFKSFRQLVSSIEIVV